ncbi:MAG TPA: class I SAM-dependent methyltransferase [Mycobacterium sp.]|nr:class I SAM-dependent methyltransferase [Mycobacterium sp.]
MKSFYQAWYRFGTPPWGRAASPDLVDLVEAGRIRPGRTIDIGCGTGPTSIYLASKGFDVTGIDFAPAAIDRARNAAADAGVIATFVVDDFTSPSQIHGEFDLLVDHGTFDDLGSADRDRYISTANRIAAPGATFYLWCFEWPPVRWERWATKAIPFGGLNVEPGEIERRFSSSWSVEPIGSSALGRWPRRSATYLMTKRA